MNKRDILFNTVNIICGISVELNVLGYLIISKKVTELSYFISFFIAPILVLIFAFLWHRIEK